MSRAASGASSGGRPHADAPLAEADLAAVIDHIRRSAGRRGGQPRRETPL